MSLLIIEFEYEILNANGEVLDHISMEAHDIHTSMQNEFRTLGGVVAYDTRVKTKALKVPQVTIQKHSVVSAEVANAMAEGAQKLFNSDFAIATTGNAGPTQGESNAEIGTVCIAIATPDGVFCEQFLFGKQRERVVTKAVNMALTMLQKEIFKN